MWTELTEILVEEVVVASLELVVEQELDNSHHKGIFHPITIKSIDIINSHSLLNIQFSKVSLPNFPATIVVQKLVVIITSIIVHT